MCFGEGFEVVIYRRREGFICI